MGKLITSGDESIYITAVTASDLCGDDAYRFPFISPHWGQRVIIIASQHKKKETMRKYNILNEHEFVATCSAIGLNIASVISVESELARCGDIQIYVVAGETRSAATGLPWREEVVRLRIRRNIITTSHTDMSDIETLYVIEGGDLKQIDIIPDGVWDVCGLYRYSTDGETICDALRRIGIKNATLVIVSRGYRHISRWDYCDWCSVYIYTAPSAGWF